jgi:glucosamine-6-phosphate deaminase
MHPAPEEKIPVQVYDDAHEVNCAVARTIADLVRQRQKEGRTCVLGLPTGSTPVGVYDELIRMHREEGLSFAHVVTFNLDEYYPMPPGSLQSYNRFMREWLFDHIDIKPQNIHIPDGTIAEADVPAWCAGYEQAIRDAGGIDLQLMGIGRTGHIGFNEPGSARNSRTRMIRLDRMTRLDAASDFFGEENVPVRAITMGVGSILDARKLILIAFGEHKAPVIAQAVEGPITPQIAASYLQEHPDGSIVLDRAAAAELTRFKAPWLVSSVEWSPHMIRKAVLWLAAELGKPILKLTDEDYNEHGLQDLVATRGSAYEINIDIFRAMHNTITGWPGGKPMKHRRSDDRSAPAREGEVFPKRVVVFSPHPDDDVISMGGTLIRLVDQGHEVHVAYQTSGNIAVFDHDALRFADFAGDFNRIFGIDPQAVARMESHIEEFLRRKTPGQVDSPEVQQIKGMIRRGEARAAGRFCGIPVERLHFLDMPFYETGKVRKKPLGDADVKIVADLLRTIQPHQIYAAGDLSDPHGTHRVCLKAIFEAIGQLQHEEWFRHAAVWLYRGAWQEWGLDELDMAVPLAPHELMRKRQAIFRHQSQKDKALFPGTDEREFWQRAEDRNRATARRYDKLGLPEYEAIEAFVQWRPDSA